jgi:hypothetical protein
MSLPHETPSERPVHGQLILREVRLERAPRERPSLQSLAEATLSWIGEEWLEQAVRDEIATLLAQNDALLPGGAPTVTVRPAPDNVRVRVPLRIAVPGSFDANADLDLRLSISAWNGAPRAWLYQFEVDVSWAAWRHAGALTPMEEVMRHLLRGFLEQELEQRVGTVLAEAVQRLCPPEDGYHLDSMWNDEQVIRFCCLPAVPRGLPITLRAFPEVNLGGTDLAQRIGM